MRIKSSFKDFYDSARYGAGDPKRIYVRKTEELEITKEMEQLRAKVPRLREIRSGLHGDYNYGLILFCGQAYPYWYVRDTYCFSIPAIIKALRTKPEFHWDISNQKEDYAEDLILAKELETSKTPKKKLFFIWGGETLTKESLKAFTQKYQSETKRILIENDTPILHLRPRYWDKGNLVKKNPRLYLLGFQKVLDPYTAYQEIEMFISNDLVKQMDPNINIPDKLKAESHGFNDLSFRRQSKKKKRPRLS